MSERYFYAKHPEATFHHVDGGRADAIDEGKEFFNLKPGDKLIVAPADPFPNVLYIHASEIIERLNEAASEYVEDCEWPDLSKEDETELEKRVNKVIQEFFDEKKLHHDFNLIGKHEEVTIE